MTLEKASALTMGLLGAMVLGMVIGPHVLPQKSAEAKTPPVLAQTVQQPATKAAEQRQTPRLTVKPVALSSPALRARVKPILNPGIDMGLATHGFHSAVEFATVARAAHNMKIPFILLKQRVLVQHETLAAAIHKSRPDVNGPIEANRARAEALSDLASLES